MSKNRASLHCAVYLIVEKDGKILLQGRQNTGFYDGYYGLPSGHWEYGESVSDAMIREAKEETNLDILKEDLELKFVCNSSQGADRNYVGFYFQAKNYSGKINVNEPDKCTDLTFYEYDNLPDNIIPYIDKVLKMIKNGENYLEEIVISPERQKEL